MNQIKRYDEIYPLIPIGSLLSDNNIPEEYQELLKMSSAETFSIL
jgi:hypothetical protein